MPTRNSLSTLFLTLLSLCSLLPQARAQTGAPVPPAAPAAAAVERLDPLDLANGAVILSKSSQYGAAQWSALALLDGTPNIGWCSDEKAPFPHQFLIELARPIALEALGFDNSANQEPNYPGISAKDVEVWASNTSPTEGFT